jgi:hypothetical protein
MVFRVPGSRSSRFEEFCFDILHASGFVNIDWRKGTGLATSPADKGRDIVCDHPRSDPDGSQYFERWFVDCKHFKKGVPPKELRNLLAWAEADRPDVAVFAVSNFLSNPAKEYLEAYRRNNHPPSRYGIGRSLSLCACSGGSSRCSASTSSRMPPSEA